ncbi:hypothetical protein OPT61_g5628 [Boeremia exigua]|uniref:Uncharacterized protein n=1 Tax=Boeremia exigua TaxID=749465 RepID=A0ACC2I9R8_9PLEO|nr:hypothetical protein OPT61_g5628 [Boeremia exigua]
MRSQWTAEHILNSVPANYPEDKPVIMLNMFRFHDQAQYPEGSKHSPCSGQEAFLTRYVEEWGKIVTDAGG